MGDVVTAIDDPANPAPEESVHLTQHTAHGFALMLAQTIITKVTGFLGQIVMARFLIPEDFGVVSLTLAAASFPSILRDAGLQAIIVQRQRHLKRWVDAAFWMSLALGTITSIITCAVSPFIARYYADPRLVGLLDLIGISAIFSSLGTVPAALLQIRLKFRFQATLALTMALLTTALNIVMARLGCGPYSLVAPLLIVNIVRTAIIWITTYHPIRWKLYLRRWKFLIGDGGTILLTQLLFMSVYNGDYLILGARYPNEKDVVGQFYFAYNLSLQAQVLLTFNVAGILFPALARLAADPVRQTQAYLRASRLMAVIGVPACFLQGALAGPGIHLLFQEKWYPAIPMVQVLSLVMAIRVIGFTYFNYAQAQGRFKLQLLTNAITCVGFMIVVTIAAYHGRGLMVACAEAIFFAITDPLWMMLALKKHVSSAIAEVARIFLPPLAAGSVAVSIAMLIGSRMPQGKLGNVLQIIVISAITVAIYAPIIRVIAPEPWQEMMQLGKRMLRRA